MKKLLCINSILLSLMLTACDRSQPTEPQQPVKSESKPAVQVQAASEVKPESKEIVPAAPSMSYEALFVSDEGVGYDHIFALQDIPDMMGQALMYQSKAGLTNIMQEVVEDPEGLGYLKLERAYKFGDQYVLVVSTGENGNSCPATTYAFAYNVKSEEVSGKTEIEGCSEVVEAFAEGNKLTVKKDGKPTIIYNAEIK